MHAEFKGLWESVGEPDIDREEAEVLPRRVPKPFLSDDEFRAIDI